MTIGQFIATFALFIWTIVTARYLGVSQYGILSFGMSFASLLVIIVDLGLGNYTTREVARDSSVLSKYVNNLFPFKILLSVCLFILSFIILTLAGKNLISIEVALICVIQIIFLSLNNLINGVFQAFEDLKSQAIGTTINSIILLGSLFVVIMLKLSILAVAFTYALGYIVFFCYMMYNYTKRFGFPKPQFEFKFWKKTAIASIPFGLSTFFASIYFTIDIILLSNLSGDFATGIYRSAYNVIAAFATFSAVYQMVIFPVLSKMFKNSNHLLKVSLEQSIKYLLLISLPLTMGVFIYADTIIGLIYNHQYDLAIEPLKILVFTVLLVFINGTVDQLLKAINKEVKVTQAFMVVVIFNAIFDIITIPYLGYNGAAFATFISEILLSCLLFYPIIRSAYCPGLTLVKTIGKLVLSTLITGVILYYLNISLWVAIPIAFVIYLICLFVTKTIDDKDKYIIREILGKN